MKAMTPLQRRTHFRQRGLSLVELMIALTLGLLLLSGLTVVFVNSSEANRELQKVAQQIENGRYGTDLLTMDLRLAGFYGHFHELPAAPASAPDPCELASATNLHAALAMPVQGFRAADLTTRADVTATSCDDKGLLTSANLRPGSDVLVIRRADTNVVPRPAGTTVTNDVYIQASGSEAQIQFGNGAALGNNRADGTASTLFLFNVPPAAPTPAPVRKYHVHVYFVAPCSIGSGTNGVCQAGDDGIPTLKRLELGASGGVTAFRIVPLVEGIEYMKVEYGVDGTPSTPATATGLIGDATVDSYAATPADFTQAIAAKVYLLARNTETSGGFSDDKSYSLGSVTVAAANDRYRRHVYAATVRLMSPAGRREIP